jgi:hypothetical protein
VAERDIQHAIREAMGLEPDLVLWRNNTGVFDDGRGGKVRTGLGTGSADLVGILRMRYPISTGRFIAIEIKQASGRVSPEQERWLALVRAFGGFAAVIRSVDDAKQALARARNGESQ